jgi:hypothetical protein
MLNIDPAPAAYVAASPEEPRTTSGSFPSRAKPNADATPRADAPDNWTLDTDAFECCCAICSSQDR